MSLFDVSLGPSGAGMCVNTVWIDGIVRANGISHTASPGDDRRIIRQKETAILGPVAVRIDRNVCDRQVLPDEKRRIGEATVQCSESAGSGSAFPRDHVPVALEPSSQRPEAQRADDASCCALFEEQPLH